MSLPLGSVSLAGKAAGDTGTFSFGGVPGLGATGSSGMATVRIINGSLLTLQINFPLTGTGYILGAGATADYQINPSEAGLRYQVLASQGTITGAALFGVWYAPDERVEPLIPGALSGSINVAQADEIYQSGETPPVFLISASPIGLSPAPYVWLKDNGSFQFGLLGADSSGNLIMSGSSQLQGTIKFTNTSTVGNFTDLLDATITGNTVAKEWRLTYNGLTGALFFQEYTDTKFPVVMQIDGSVLLGHQTVTVSATGVVTANAPITLAASHQETGQFYVGAVATGAGQTIFGGANFKTVMTNTPSSVTLTPTSSSNAGSPTASLPTIYGCRLSCVSVAAGVSFEFGTYVTVGNTLRAVDVESRTIEHHCEHCDTLRSDIPFAEVQVVHFEDDTSTMGYVCPSCGTSEWFTLTLTDADEQSQDITPSGTLTRGQIATNIRTLQAALGLPLA